MPPSHEADQADRDETAGDHTEEWDSFEEPIPETQQLDGTLESIAVLYMQTEFGKEIYRQGFELGLRQAFIQYRTEIMRALVHTHFSPDPAIPGLIDRLIEMSDDAFGLIFDTDSLDDLLWRMSLAS